MLDAKKCIELYHYCQQQYEKLEKKDKHYTPKHDKQVMEMAAKEFQINESVANKAFDLAAQTILRSKKDQYERIIRNKLLSFCL